ASNDGTNWFALSSPAAQNITVNGTLLFSGGSLINPGFKHVRVAFACASGSYTATTTILGKGPV
nr:hypothetical protein [Gemmatimonadaceae bacterium]